MDSLLTKQGALSSQVTEAHKMGSDERNIGGRYNTTSLMEFLQECKNKLKKLTDWLDKKLGEGGIY